MPFLVALRCLAGWPGEWVGWGCAKRFMEVNVKGCRGLCRHMPPTHSHPTLQSVNPGIAAKGAEGSGRMFGGAIIEVGGRWGEGVMK